MSPLLFYKGIVGKFTIKNLCGDKIISKYPYNFTTFPSLLLSQAASIRRMTGNTPAASVRSGSLWRR